MKKQSSFYYYFTKAALVFFCFLGIMQGPTYGQAVLPFSIKSRITDLKRKNRLDEALLWLENIRDSISIFNPDHKLLFEITLIEADIERMKGDYLSGLFLLDSLSKSIDGQNLNNDPLMAQLYTVQGTIFLTHGELEKGHGAIQKAIKIYKSNFGEDDTLLAPCYNKMGNYYYFNNNMDSAVSYYAKALKIAGKKIDNLAERASYIQNIGIIYFEKSEYVKAESCFLEALKLKESIYSPISFSLGRIYLNIGRFYQGISALDKALYYLEKAEHIFSSKGVMVHVELGKTYWNKGLIYYLVGDNEMALTYLFNAKQLIDSVHSNNKYLIASLNSDIGNVYRAVGEYDKALKYYNISITGADLPLKIKTYRNIANLYLEDNKPDQAGYYFKKLIGLSEDENSKNSIEAGLTWLYYGNYLAESTLENREDALEYLEKAFEIFTNNIQTHNRDAAAVIYSIGDYYFKLGQVHKALTYYQQSLIMLSDSAFADTNILINPPLCTINADLHIVKALAGKAKYLKIFYELNKQNKILIASAQSYILCMDLLDHIRMNYRAENSQMALFNFFFDVYNQAISTCLEIYEITNEPTWLNYAFELSEKSKSMILLAELKDANAKKIGLIPETLRALEKDIKSNINFYLNNIYDEENQDQPDLKKLSYLHSNLLRFEKRHDSLINYLEQHFPEYYKLKYDPSVISIEQMQDKLEKNEVLIEYSLLKDYVFIFLITRDNYDYRKVPIDSTLIQDVFALRNNLDLDHVTEYTYTDFLEYQHMAYKLYSILLRPFESYLASKKLIIIPDEELSYLSYEALIQDTIHSDTINFRRLPYVINKCPVSYAASATILSMIKTRKMHSLDNGVLALAPSTNMLRRSFMKNNQELAKEINMKLELPGAEWETENILKIIKGKKLIGEQATESELKKLAPSYDILHFATHTWIDDENPLSSMLSFYPYSNDGEDGVLHTYEIYNMELNGELAVLSACSTGEGKLQKGEGVISLARAFTYAGMPSVIMTLWPVDDISSGNIIPLFYTLLGKGVDKDFALRLAKMNYLENTKPEIETHPAFWSGYVLYGNNKGFHTPIDKLQLILLVVFGMMIIIIVSILYKNYKQFRKTRNKVYIDLPEKLRI